MIQLKHLCLDMDGTIYNGNAIFPFTVAALQTLDELQIGYTFLTNNPTKSVADYLQHLWEFGIEASAEHIYTSSMATIDHLRCSLPHVRRIFFLGTTSMIAEFERAGFTSTSDSADDEPDAVIVAFDPTMTYARLCRAAWWIGEGKPFIATNPDFVCPTNERTVLVDCGSITAALTKATGKRPLITLGKPDPTMIDGILRRHNLRRNEVAMVGDRVYTDIRMAENASVMGVLVLSGETTLETVNQLEKKPDMVVDHLGVLCDRLRIAHTRSGG